MAKSPATVNQNGSKFIRKADEMNNHLSSSPRRTAIGKPSLRLSIPTIEQIAETKNQPKLNQIDPVSKKSESSFVKRMIDNCNHSGQLNANIDGLVNVDGQHNIENVAEICDTNRVKSVIEKLDKSKRTNCTNGKSPTETKNAVATDISQKQTKNPNIEVTIENDNENVGNNEEPICAHDSNDNFPSYSKFENDFKKRMNDFNAGRFDAHGMQNSYFKYIFWSKKVFDR